MILPAVLALSLASVADRRCPGDHTIVDSHGDCVCAPGYPFGDPDSHLGCFNCSTPCQENALCVSSVVCECRPGFSLDRRGECVPFFPLPVTITPSSGSHKGGYKVDITLQSATNSTTVFCRFGNIIIAGFLRDRQTIACLAPAGDVGDIELRVSDDANDWNLPGIAFRYRKDTTDVFVTHALSLFVIAAIVVVVYVTVGMLGAPGGELVTDEELQPLKQSMPSHSDLSTLGFYPL
jgi:hypothetical protein